MTGLLWSHLMVKLLMHSLLGSRIFSQSLSLYLFPCCVAAFYVFQWRSFACLYTGSSIEDDDNLVTVAEVF